MSYPARQFHRKPAPTKAQQRCEAHMIVLQRAAAGLEFPEYVVASIARTHSMSVAEVEKLVADEIARRAADAA